MRLSTLVRRLLLLFPIFLFGGCAHEEHVIGSSDIRVDEPDRTLVGLSKVFHDGQHVGYVRTYRMTGEVGAREVMQVSDLRHNRLGYVDDRGRSYRITAHAGTEFVAESSDLRRNVAAVMGLYTGRVELVDEVGP
jgi:hypothetical protein